MGHRSSVSRQTSRWLVDWKRRVRKARTAKICDYLCLICGEMFACKQTIVDIKFSHKNNVNRTFTNAQTYL